MSLYQDDESKHPRDLARPTYEDPQDEKARLRHAEARWYVENREGRFYAGHGRWVEDPGLAHDFATEREATALRDYFTPLYTRVVHM